MRVNLALGQTIVYPMWIQTASALVFPHTKDEEGICQINGHIDTMYLGYVIY